MPVSTHSRPKAAGASVNKVSSSISVSTHSRPKAAGPKSPQESHRRRCFNSQPPEGGWMQAVIHAQTPSCFNSQPPEGGCAPSPAPLYTESGVSTHSRPKAAGNHLVQNLNHLVQFQLTAARRRLVAIPANRCVEIEFQLTAARRRLATERGDGHLPLVVSTHSRPKAAG